MCCSPILNLQRKWGNGAANGCTRNSSFPCLPRTSKKFCASYANPERHSKLRAILRIWRTSGESARVGPRHGQAKPRGNRAHSRLGNGKTLPGKSGQSPCSARPLRQDSDRQRSDRHLPADLAALSSNKLESGARAIPAGAALLIRCSAHLRSVRPAGAARRVGVPEKKNSVRRGTHRHVPADCPEYSAETALPSRLGPRNVAGSECNYRDGGAGTRRVDRGRHPSGENSAATQRRGSAQQPSRPRTLPRVVEDSHRGEAHSVSRTVIAEEESRSAPESL